MSDVDFSAFIRFFLSHSDIKYWVKCDHNNGNLPIEIILYSTELTILSFHIDAF